MSTRTISAMSGATLLHLHHKRAKQNAEKRQHDNEQRPQNQMIHGIPGLAPGPPVHAVLAIEHIAVALCRITGAVVVLAAGHLNALLLRHVANRPRKSGARTIAHKMSAVNHGTR